MHTEESAALYEHNQTRNPINQWLHSFRFRHLLEVITELKQPARVVEIGSAHGKLFGLLRERFDIDYVGIELDAKLTAISHERYGRFSNFKAIAAPAAEALVDVRHADIVVALETLEHIPEAEALRTLDAIRDLRPKLFVCSVPVELGPALWVKNVGSWLTGYSRHTEYTWRETFWAGLGQLHRLPPHTVNHKGFDWHWLLHSIHERMRVREIRRFPFGLPMLSTSVFIVAEER